SVSVFSCKSIAKVGREGGDTALARQVISNERDTRGQRRGAGFENDGARSQRSSYFSWPERTYSFTKRHLIPLSIGIRRACKHRALRLRICDGRGSEPASPVPLQSAYLAGTV